MHKQRLFILIAAAVGLVGCILPWQSVSMGFLGTVSANAFNSGWAGYGTLAGIIGAGAVIFKDKDRSQVVAPDTKKIVLGAAGAAALFSLLAIVIIASGSAGYMGIGVSLGIGPFFTLIAGAAIAAIPFAIKGDGNFQMPTKDSIKDDLK